LENGLQSIFAVVVLFLRKKLPLARKSLQLANLETVALHRDLLARVGWKAGALEGQSRLIGQNPSTHDLQCE
jgi:hypothetical protein